MFWFSSSARINPTLSLAHTTPLIALIYIFQQVLISIWWKKHSARDQLIIYSGKEKGQLISWSSESYRLWAHWRQWLAFIHYPLNGTFIIDPWYMFKKKLITNLDQCFNIGFHVLIFFSNCLMYSSLACPRRSLLSS